MSRYYSRLGWPISLQQWGELMNDDEYRRVASTHVGRWWISTVWLGLDHSWSSIVGGPDVPMIFETMVFDENIEGSDKYNDLKMRRYATEEQALLGHDVMVQEVSEWIP